MDKCKHPVFRIPCIIITIVLILAGCRLNNHNSRDSLKAEKSGYVKDSSNNGLRRFDSESAFDTAKVYIGGNVKDTTNSRPQTFDSKSTFDTTSITVEGIKYDDIKAAYFPSYDHSQISVIMKIWPFRMSSYLAMFTLPAIRDANNPTSDPDCSIYKLVIFEHQNRNHIQKIAESEWMTLRPTGMQDKFDWYDKFNGLGDDDKQVLQFETKCPYVYLAAITYKIAENVTTFCINSELYDSYPGGDHFEARSLFLFAQIKDSIYCVLEYLMNSSVVKATKEFSEDGFSFHADASLAYDARLEMLDHKTNGFFDFRIKRFYLDMLQVVRDSVDLSEINPDVVDTLKWGDLGYYYVEKVSDTIRTN